MNNYFELKIKINPEIAEILSAICFENLDCEGVVLAEETYKDDLVLVSTTEETLKVYLKPNENRSHTPSPLGGEGRISVQGTNTRNSDDGPISEKCKQVLQNQRKLLLERGFSESDLGSWEWEISDIENQDWSKKWKENWNVTKITEKITVVPSWIEYEPHENEIVIKLDPGSAFGTGTHPTTQLCILASEKYLKKGDKMADIGTGSGILAICAAKLGAQSIYGCDNDELVIETARENAKMNDVYGVFEYKTADKLTEKYDFITANILHNVLAEIMGNLKALMADDAKLVLSGIIEDKKQVVLDAIQKHDLKLIEELQQDIWVGLVVEKVNSFV